MFLYIHIAPRNPAPRGPPFGADGQKTSGRHCADALGGEKNCRRVPTSPSGALSPLSLSELPEVGGGGPGRAGHRVDRGEAMCMPSQAAGLELPNCSIFHTKNCQTENL